MLHFRFIYLEFPKFLGSSYAWTDSAGNEKGVFLEELRKHDNIIPKEIVERIIDAIILRRDDFKVGIYYCINTDS